jgi:hypothetical protein
MVKSLQREMGWHSFTLTTMAIGMQRSTTAILMAPSCSFLFVFACGDWSFGIPKEEIKYRDLTE